MRKFKALKLRDKIATIILIIGGIFALSVILYSIFLSVDYYSFKCLRLETKSQGAAAARKFEIDLTENINLQQIGYDLEDGKMYLLIGNVKDIHSLYTDNLDCIGCGEEDFDRLFYMPFDSFGYVDSKFFKQEYQGCQFNFSNNNNEFTTVLYNKSGILYCELGRKLDLQFIKEIRNQ